MEGEIQGQKGGRILNTAEMVKLTLIRYMIHCKKLSWYGVTTLFFLVIAFVDLIFFYEMEGNSVVLLVVFIYIPLTVGINMSTVETSKINYLIPKSIEEHKKLKCCEAVMIFVISLLSSLAIIGVVFLISTTMGIFCSYVYAVIGLPITAAMSFTGFGIYYKKGEKRKKVKNLLFLKITIGALFGIGSIFLTDYLFNIKSYFLWNIITAVSFLVTIGYVLYYVTRIRKLELRYDDINFEYANLYRQTGYHSS